MKRIRLRSIGAVCLLALALLLDSTAASARGGARGHSGGFSREGTASGGKLFSPGGDSSANHGERHNAFSGASGENQSQRQDSHSQNVESRQSGATDRSENRTDAYEDRTDAYADAYDDRTDAYRDRDVYIGTPRYGGYYYDDNDNEAAAAAVGFIVGAAVGSAVASSKNTTSTTSTTTNRSSTQTTMAATSPPPPNATLPCNPDVIQHKGVTYYQCGQTYYMQAYGSAGPIFMPVPPPGQ